MYLSPTEVAAVYVGAWTLAGVTLLGVVALIERWTR